MYKIIRLSLSTDKGLTLKLSAPLNIINGESAMNSIGMTKPSLLIIIDTLLEKECMSALLSATDLLNT